jgi:hypothetical protein
MRSIKFLGFAAGVILAAGSTVMAQTGPTFPTTPPVTVDGSVGDSTVGSGTSVDPRSSIDPGKPRTSGPEGIEVILPGTDPGAGR